jgi:hypothetical protein
MNWLIGLALAQVDPSCGALQQPPVCDGTNDALCYDETTQADFLANYPALASTFSPLHAPVPHDAGKGSVGVDFQVIPPLSCGKRFVLDWTKTEDANKTPVLPRPTVSFAFQPIRGRIYPYGSFGFVPPVAIPDGDFTVRTTLAAVEFGFGLYLSEDIQVGLRGHSTMMRTLGNVATAYEGETLEYDDLYIGSSSGVDVMLGLSGDTVTPYMSVGWVETQSFFWIGDDGFVSTNRHPYSGPAVALGGDALVMNQIRLVGEFYAAPGGYKDLTDNPETQTFGPVRRYGRIYTARFRLAKEF